MKSLPALCMALSLLTCAPALANCLRPADTNARISQNLAQVNAYRTAAGLRTVSLDAKLIKAAENHACDMAQMGKYSHSGSNGSDLVARLQAQRYRYRAANENVGQFRDTTSAAGWWYNSPGHRANILSPNVQEVGFGVAVGADEKYYWVMVAGTSR